MFFSNLYLPSATQRQESEMENEAPAGIEIVPMIQTLNSEMRDKVEDWTGKSSTVERRKLQNRLNQRASRKRRMKAIAVKTSMATTATRTTTTMLTNSANYVHPPSDVLQLCLLPATRNTAISTPSFASLLTPLPSDQKLITLMRLNLIRAIAQNVALLGLDMEQMDLDILSPFNFESGRSKIGLLPPALQPTKLQLSIPHHPEVDTFPFPEYRDNLLMAGSAIDDFEFCMDALYGVDATGIEPSYSARTGLIVWDSPWLQSSWEIDEDFARKYKKLFRGCQKLIETSNYWRSFRGEPPLAIEFESLD